MIFAFTKDWDDVPTCTTHLLREMAKTLPVLWVSSIGTRKPSAVSAKDLRRIARRIRNGLRPAAWKENRLRVLNPLLLPKAESRLAVALNRRLFAWHVRRETAAWMNAMAAPSVHEYWCFVPNAVDLLPVAEAPGAPRRVIYYCADDWTQFHNLDGAWMKRKEQELLGRADLVFASSRILEARLEARQAQCADRRPSAVVYMPHGVEYDRFAQALDKTTSVPTELAALQKPVIGFYGNLHPWVDFGLIAALAQARPEWSFVLIGEAYADVSALTAMANVHLLGRREHSVLHNYCRGFDVAMIPYAMTDPRMQSVNPVKTKELLAAGLPIGLQILGPAFGEPVVLRVGHAYETEVAANLANPHGTDDA